MKLIVEKVEDVSFLEEEVEPGSGKKSLHIEGVFLQGEVRNRNGRIYPMGVLEAAVERYSKLIEEKRALGELNHPQGPTINLDRVSHRIISLRREGNDFIGKARVLTEQPMGRIVSNLIAEGVKLGVSSRGMGTLKPNKNGIMEVQKDFYLATAADIVNDPSAPDAFVNGIMEGVDWVFDVASNSWRVAEIVERVERASAREVQERKVAWFGEFIAEVARSGRS